MGNINHPNFLIIGAEKSGTTSLYHYLNQHPEIFMTPEKEPFYYVFKNGTPKILGDSMNQDAFLKSRIRTDELYAKQFEGVLNETAIGEASASYIYIKEAAENIYEDIPGAKLIVVLRNPVDRAYSNFLHCIRRGVEPLRDFNSYVKSKIEEERIKENKGLVLYYLEKGFYFKYLSNYFDRFDRSNIKVVLYENLKRHPRKTVSEIYSFLNVDSTFKPDMKQVYNVSEKKGLEKNVLTDLHKSKSPIVLKLKKLLPVSFRKLFTRFLNQSYKKEIPPITDETRAELKDLFKPDIKKLERLINIDLSSWK